MNTPAVAFDLVPAKPRDLPTLPRMRASLPTWFEDRDPTLVLPAAAVASLCEACALDEEDA